MPNVAQRLQRLVWQEGPLLIVQAKPGRHPAKQNIRDFLASRIAKWWMPDDVIFVDGLPHTATGKLLKTELRAKFGGRLAVNG
jgi:acyl-CoA synthetase (AMP-forming)/AMP-acid ligase II